MEKVPVLRLRHDHTFPLEALKDRSLSGSFTIEAWVCPASMDRAALLYPEKGYEGNVVRLKPGLYRNMVDEHLPSLGSADLPDFIEAVFFTEPNFNGIALAQREDLADIPAEHQKIGSVVVLDRSHGRQNHVVLFEGIGFTGRAQLLVLPDHWQQPPVPDAPASIDEGKITINEKSPAFGQHTANPISMVRSAWVPPGVALDVLTTEGNITLLGDMYEMPDLVLNVQPRRDTPLTGNSILCCLDFTGERSLFNVMRLEETCSFGWVEYNTKFRYRIPEGYALFLFEHDNKEGKYEIVVGGRDDLKNLGWTPKWAIYASAPDDVLGVIAFNMVGNTFKTATVIAAGKALPDTTWFWFPPEYCLSKDSGERVGANGMLGNATSLEGYTVTRYCSVLANPAGYGLTIDRQPSRLLNAPDELRFGDSLLRPDRWYHIAQTWQGGWEEATMQWILDGRVEKEVKFKEVYIESQDWIVAQGFRGAMTKLRVWGQVLPIDFIKKNRFLGVINPADNLINGEAPRLFAQPELKDFVALPDAALIDAELPSPPEKTMLMQGMMQQAEAEHQQNMLVANQEANTQKAKAIKKAQYKVAQAHEKARRDIHFRGLKRIAFVRGGQIIHGKPSEGALNDSSCKIVRGNDLVVDDTMDTFYVAAESRNGGEITALTKNGELFFPIMPPPMTLAKVVADNHPLSTGRGDGHVRTGLYFIDADGILKNTWGYIEADNFYFDPPLALNSVEKNSMTGLPLGLPNSWDLVVGHTRNSQDENCFTFLFWTNGREIYLGYDSFKVLKDADGNLRLDKGNQVLMANRNFAYSIFIPHASSPNPVAIDALVTDNVTHLVWLDAKDEVLRVLKITEGNDNSWSYGQPADLYPAFNPGPGLSICKIPNPSNPAEEVAYIYWVAGERKTLEVPVLDTPGRYFDLFDNLSGAFSNKQHVAIVETEDMAGAEWTEETAVISMEFNDPTVFGPFDVKEGLEMHLKLRLDNNPGSTLAFLSFNLNSPRIINESGILHRLEGGSHRKNNLKLSLPLGEWLNLKVTFQETRFTMENDPPEGIEYLCITIYKDDQQIGYDTVRQGDMEWGEEVSLQLPALFFPNLNYEFKGAHLAEVVVKSINDSASTLAYASINKVEGKISKKKEALPPRLILDNDNIPTDLPVAKTKALTFKTSDDHIAYSPIRLNLKQGWTASANLIWERPQDIDSPICIYELATFEEEERLVCAIDRNGIPKFYFRWEGRNCITEESYGKGFCFSDGKTYRVTWMIEPGGKFQTYVNDELGHSGRFNFKPKEHVFEGHRLGAPCEFQDHHIVNHALVDWNAEDNQHFDGFTGKIIRFTAWNTYVPNAIHGVEGTPEADLSWDRSLVTVESRRRYMRAGRLDGQEPPVTLFPIEMDGGLSVESELQFEHAQHTYAQNQLSAAKQYEAHRKAEALHNAQAELAAAHRKYDDEHAKGQADIAAAQAKADLDIAAEEQRKADTDAKAARDQSEGKEQADGIKDNAQQQYNDQVNAASADKRNKVNNANSKLANKRDQRDAKQKEYDEKRG